MEKVGGLIGIIVRIPAKTTLVHVRYAQGSNRSPSSTARSSPSSQSTTLQEPKWATSTPQQERKPLAGSNDVGEARTIGIALELV